MTKEGRAAAPGERFEAVGKQHRDRKALPTLCQACDCQPTWPPLCVAVYVGQENVGGACAATHAALARISSQKYISVRPAAQISDASGDASENSDESTTPQRRAAAAPVPPATTRQSDLQVGG